MNQIQLNHKLGVLTTVVQQSYEQVDRHFREIARHLSEVHALISDGERELDHPFHYTRVKDATVKTGRYKGYHFRITDDEDHRIATCYNEINAKFIVGALNTRAKMKES